MSCKYGFGIIFAKRVVIIWKVNQRHFNLSNLQELENQVDWVTISTENSVHKDEVIKVEYFSDNNTIVSCSNDPVTTLIIRYLAGRRAPYIFKLTRVRYLFLSLAYFIYG